MSEGKGRRGSLKSLASIEAEINDVARVRKRMKYAKYKPALDKVELHVHLDGSLKTNTIYEIAKDRGIKLPDDVTDAASLKKYVTVPPNTGSLTEFLSTFFFFTPILKGCPKAIERISYECAEEQSKHGVYYSEIRYCPQLMVDEENGITSKHVVEAVCRGLDAGSKKFKIKTTTILCFMRSHPQWAEETLALAEEFQYGKTKFKSGVVGVDLAGDESFSGKTFESVFKKAKELGIHRTVHAGESGPASNVEEAINVLHAERVGHGYHCLDDPKVYKLVKEKDIHLECCVVSSLHTGAVEDIKNHPVNTFASDRINFSLSTDDPGVLDSSIAHEYDVAFHELNWSHSLFTYTTFNAARSSFLPEKEKVHLIQHLKRFYLPSAMHE
eukprot:Nk52_evm56s239 gene=Nk52_evmTU56s239